MFNLISKLSNVEQLSSFIKPYSDRVKKLGELAHVFDKLIQVELDGEPVTASTTQKLLTIAQDDWVDFIEPFTTMIGNTGNSVIFTNPISGYTTVLDIDTTDPDLPLQVFSCEVNSNDGSYSRRFDPALFVQKELDPETSQYVYKAYWYALDLLDCRSGSAAEKVDLLDYASRLQDQLSSYNISLDAIKLTIKNKLMNAGDYVAHIKTMYTGLKNGSLDLFQNITNALTTHDVSSIVSVFKNFMNPSGVSVNNDGSVNFPETSGTSELNFGAVIASALPSVVTMLGSVVTAISAPIGIAITGLGAIASAATNAIANAANDATRVLVDAESENVDISIKVRQESYGTDAVGRINRNCIMNTIAKGDYAPHKYELPGLSGYIWPVNYTGTAQSVLNCTAAHECYLSCRGYMNHADLLELASLFFQFSRISYSYSSGAGSATVRITPHPNIHLDSLLNEYYAHLIPIDFNEVTTMSDDEVNLLYQKCVLTDCVIATLLYAAFYKLDGLGDYLDIIVPIANHTFNPDSNVRPYRLTHVGIQFLVDPYHDTFYQQPMYSWDSDAADWDYNPNLLVTPFSEYNEVQMSKVSTAVDEQGIDDDFNRMILEQVQWISENAMTLYDPLDSYSSVDASFQFFPVEQRFNFRMRPPKWTRRSLIFNLILTGVIIAAVATITAIAYVKINKWRQDKQRETQIKTEAAWDKCKSDPSPENLKAYKKAALKQNTIGKLYGCSTVSKNNYWATPEQPSSTPSDVSNDIENLIPTSDENIKKLYLLISGLALE